MIYSLTVGINMQHACYNLILLYNAQYIESRSSSLYPDMGVSEEEKAKSRKYIFVYSFNVLWCHYVCTYYYDY